MQSLVYAANRSPEVWTNTQYPRLTNCFATTTTPMRKITFWSILLSSHGLLNKLILSGAMLGLKRCCDEQMCHLRGFMLSPEAPGFSFRTSRCQNIFARYRCMDVEVWKTQDASRASTEGQLKGLGFSTSLLSSCTVSVRRLLYAWLNMILPRNCKTILCINHVMATNRRLSSVPEIAGCGPRSWTDATASS